MSKMENTDFIPFLGYLRLSRGLDISLPRQTLPGCAGLTPMRQNLLGFVLLKSMCRMTIGQLRRYEDLL